MQSQLRYQLLQIFNSYEPTGLYDDEIEKYGQRNCFEMFRQLLIRANEKLVRSKLTQVRKKYVKHIETQDPKLLEELTRLFGADWMNLPKIAKTYKKCDKGSYYHSLVNYEEEKEKKINHIYTSGSPFNESKVRERIKMKYPKKFKKRLSTLQRDWRKKRRGKLRDLLDAEASRKCIIQIKKKMESDPRYIHWQNLVDIVDKLGILDYINNFNALVHEQSKSIRANGESYEKQNTETFYQYIAADLDLDSVRSSYFPFVKWRDGEYDLVVLYEGTIVALGELKRCPFDISHGMEQLKSLPQRIKINGKWYPISTGVKLYVGTQIKDVEYHFPTASKIVHLFNSIHKIKVDRRILLPNDMESCIELYHYIRAHHYMRGRPLTKSPIQTLLDHSENVFIL